MHSETADTALWQFRGTLYILKPKVLCGNELLWTCEVPRHLGLAFLGHFTHAQAHSPVWE